MSTIQFIAPGASRQSFPTAKSYQVVNRDILLAGLRQLVRDYRDLAAEQGIPLAALQVPARDVLEDVAAVLQVTWDELQAALIGKPPASEAQTTGQELGNNR